MTAADPGSASGSDAGPPIRSLHHFACTGGTLVARCLAAQPMVRLLSEIDPLSRMMLNHRQPRFTPSDLIHQLQYGPRPVAQGWLVELFQVSVLRLRALCAGAGEHLVLRDHAHSLYCQQRAPDGSRPGLYRILAAVAPVRAAVTVRDPMASFLSLRRNDWVRFQPASIAEYARRYHAFLDDHAGLPVFRHEDLVADPDAVLAGLCAALELPFRSGAAARIGGLRLSGHAGPGGDGILARPARPVPPPLAEIAAGSADFLRLRARLGYA